MRAFSLSLLTAILLASSTAMAAPNYCHHYPHWSDCEENILLKKLEAFVGQYKKNASQYIAAFDWDGTLYNEQIAVHSNGKTLIRSGQSAWHLWGADKLQQHSAKRYNALFPSFKQFNPDGNSVNYSAWSNNITEMDNYIEGMYKTLSEDQTNNVQNNNLPHDTYDKFSQIASFEQGMTFHELQNGVHDYLQAYPAPNYAFLKIVDILHRLEVAGFQVWIITGSNPYFVANLITDEANGINHSNSYQILAPCQSLMDQARQATKNLTPEQFFSNCTIAGNAAVWAGGNSPFTRNYDNRNFNTAPSANRMAIDHYGKWFAAQHIVALTNKPIAFYAGNSDGDYSLMKRILANAFDAPFGTFGVFVQPDQHGGQDLQYLEAHNCLADRCGEVEKL